MNFQELFNCLAPLNKTRTCYFQMLQNVIHHLLRNENISMITSLVISKVNSIPAKY